MRALVRIAYDLRYAANHFTGIGTHAFSLLDALLRLGGDERYVVMWSPRLEPCRYDVRAFSKHPRVEWRESDRLPLSPSVPWSTGAWLREIRPDAYLSPFYFMPANPGCPCALTAHDVWPLRLKDRLSPWRALATRFAFARLRKAALVLTSSEFSRNEIHALLRIPLDRVRTIPLGVPPRVPLGGVRPPANAPDGPFALAVGDNRPRKNLALLGRVWGSFGDRPPLALVHAGREDARYESMAALAEREGARDVRALGWVSEPELEWLYAHASLVLFPSRYEGFGFPLLEAMARGVPAISADIPTSREVAGDAVPFLDPDDTTAWADAVRRLATSEPERARRIEAGRRRAAELDYRRTAEATRDALSEIAGRAVTAVRG